MSFRAELPRPPAFADSAPAPVTFVPVSPSIRRALAPVFGGDAAIERLEGATLPEPVGHFRIQPAGGGPVLFAKVLPREHAANAARMTRLAAQLPVDAPVVRAMPGFPQPVGERCIVYAYPFVAGRAPRASREDLGRIGAALARLHRLLEALDGTAAIRAAAVERTALLEQTRASWRPNSVPSALSEALALLDNSLAAVDDMPTGPLHGDVNPRNIIMADASDANGIDPAVIEKVVFLDLEDMPHSWGPPVLDIAMIVERLCLAVPHAGEAVALAVAVLAAYGHARGAAPIPRPGALAEALAVINLRAVLLLAAQAAAGLSPAPSECAKFLGNAQRLATMKPLLAAIETQARRIRQ
jgi:hypothetical protein